MDLKLVYGWDSSKPYGPWLMMIEDWVVVARGKSCPALVTVIGAHFISML
jgi:hypothetical protein